MQTFSRKRLAVALAGLLTSIAPVGPAMAQLAVVCANCSSEWTQLANNAELVAQVANQAQQLQQQIQQYELLAQNTAGLPNQIWGNAANDIARVNSLMAQSQALSASSSNLAAAFAARFPGYQQYASSTITPAAMDGKYQQWSSDTNSTVLSTLQAAGLQTSQLQDEGSTLQQLEAMSGSAAGQMQALEVGNQLAAQTVMQGQKLRQLMVDNLNLEASYVQSQQDRDAVQAAALRQFTAPASPNNTGNERY
jgi:P-type conjugative transfer protein TrbJ